MHRLATVVIAVLAAAPLVAAEPLAAWAEGESPAVAPPALAAPGFPVEAVQLGAAWGNSAIMSQGRLLHLTLNEDQVAKHVPADGLVFAYDLAVAAGGRHEVWGRVGYEWARSPMRWRVAGGAWAELPADAPTTDVMPIQTWNELGWLRFGDADLQAGTVRIEVAWPRTTRVEKGQEKPNRILGMLDALCVAAPGTFKPNGRWQPGQDHRGDVDKAAEQLVFKLPETAAGERSTVALTGAWQYANWDEDANPADRLGPVQQLPSADGLRWFAYQVPGDRNAQRPEFAFHHRFIARCRVDVPAAMAGRSFVLDIQRFNSIASVIVNGRYCGFSKAHSTEWRPDITPAIRPGINEIAVVVKDRYYAQDVGSDKGGWRSCWNTPGGFMSSNQGVCGRYELAVAADEQAGLTEPVSLVAAGPVYAADVFVKTSVARKELALEVTLANPGPARTVTLACAAVPWSADGAPAKAAKTVKPVEVALAAGESKTVALAEGWADPRLWWPDDVHLYQLVATITERGATIDVSRTRFGFREWSWDSHVFRLNGVKWQVWADTEYNGSPRELVANRAKTGCNMLRLWTDGGLAGMSRREVLDYCDEQGVLVRESGTFDGQLANYGGGLAEEVVVDGKKIRRAKKILFDNWKEQLAAWVKAERNHASIFIWSAENEVTYINVCNLGMTAVVEPAISDAVRNVVMKTDPTRPAMVDGGNAHQDESLPVNGGHYTEDYNTHWRDFPDSCYARDHWYDSTSKSRGVWRFVPDRPIMMGEVFFAEGYGTERLATIGGERCFIGVGETRGARGVLGRIFSEGWRWGEVAGWHFWLGGGDFDYRSAWQPVAVLCRQWNTSFGPGQQVDRLLKVFNNTSSDAPITATWELRIDGAKAAGGSRDLALAAGTDGEWPVSFAVPAVAKRTLGTFILTASRNGTELFRDQREVRILVPSVVAKPALTAAELAVWDPSGGVTAFLAARGIPHTATRSIDEIPPAAKVLVVGPDAIPAERAGDTLWYSRAIAGLKILVLDQRHPLRYRALPADLEPLDDKPTVWAQMQAKAAGVPAELRGRYGFAEDLNHPGLAGLVQADFFTWGGDHVMYRNPYRKGTRGYRSLLQCEEGLACTALAECQTGDGLMILSQLAIGEKLATEAVAQQVFTQLLGYAAAYAPVRRGIQAVVAADGPMAKALNGIGVRHQPASDVAAAIRADGIAVVEATPSNLAALAERDEAVRAWCARGNWMMLSGVSPDGLASFNKLVQWNHVLRPFETERVLLAVPSDPLTAGLTLRDVVLDTGRNMYPWMALKKPDSDEFSWIVDHTDVAPFCAFPKPTEMGKSSDTDPGADHWPRNMVNGFTSDDNWSFCYTVIMDRGQKLKWTLTLPKEEEVVAFKIRPSRIYHPITRMNLYFDDDATPVAVDIRADPVDQELGFPGRKARRVTMEVAKWEERGTANIVVIDNLWLKVRRPAEYLQRVKPLLNIGGLVRYDVGKGGIVLNQMKMLDREVNPVNADKKRTVLKTLLANLGAVFAGERTVVAGDQLRYAPVRIPDRAFNAYVTRDKQPGWWKGPGDMAGLPVGEQTFSGVRFFLSNFSTSPVPTVFMLRGHEASVNNDRIDGIAVNAKADALFFLHTCNRNPNEERAFSQQVERARREHRAEPEPPVVVTYQVRYADGSTAQAVARWGREIGHWTAKAPAGLPAASVGWAGRLADAKDGGFAVAYLMQWTNPRPDLEIAAVDLVAGEAKQASAVVFAITAATIAR